MPTPPGGTTCGGRSGSANASTTPFGTSPLSERHVASHAPGGIGTPSCVFITRAPTGTADGPGAPNEDAFSEIHDDEETLKSVARSGDGAAAAASIARER